MKSAYLDASALVKLFKREPESGALKAALDAWPIWVSSELVAVEATCAARRLKSPEAMGRAERQIERMQLITVSSRVLARARGSFRTPMRALDAIHLATALSLGGDVGAFFAYDHALLNAAGASGLPMKSPA